MSGHNRWSKIKHKKGASDAKKSKVWTKLIKEITISARTGGDPTGNPRLRTAIDKARGQNMPNDTIERAVKKGNGKLGSSGSVAYMFKKLGVVAYESSAVDENKVTDAAIELGAEDVKTEDDVLTVITTPKELERIRDGLKAAGMPEPLSAEVTMVPENKVHLAGRDAEVALKLLDALEDNDDVQNVYSNLDVDDSELEKD